MSSVWALISRRGGVTPYLIAGTPRRKGDAPPQGIELATGLVLGSDAQMSAQYGPLNLITDVAGLWVGNAQDGDLKSGTTVLTAAKPFTASAHVMGGAPGTRDTDLLAPDKTVQQVDALVLSGGSAFGLDACSGVMDALRAQGRGFAVGPVTVPIVPGAILFDLTNGGNKNWQTNPYAALGKAAFEAAGASFELGSVGAGTGALAARQKGGLGSASVVLDDGKTVGALVAVNALGSVTSPGDRHFWAAPFEIGDEFGGLGPDPALRYTAPDPSLKAQAMGANTPMAFAPLGAAAATCLSRAIARAVYEATPAAGDVLPTYR